MNSIVLNRLMSFFNSTSGLFPEIVTIIKKENGNAQRAIVCQGTGNYVLPVSQLLHHFFDIILHILRYITSFMNNPIDRSNTSLAPRGFDRGT